MILKTNNKIEVLSVTKVFNSRTFFNFHCVYFDTQVSIKIFTKKDFTPKFVKYVPVVETHCDEDWTSCV